MTHAERCPVCNGSGSVSMYTPGFAYPSFFLCASCGGSGIIYVPDCTPQIPMQIPVVPHYLWCRKHKKFEDVEKDLVLYLQVITSGTEYSCGEK